jgi:transposase
MPKTRKPYPAEFREQLVGLVHAGRTPEDLAREFEPTAQSISNWVAQADRDAGRRTDHGRSDRVAAAPPRESAAEGRARHLVKRRGWFAQETTVNTKRSSGS